VLAWRRRPGLRPWLLAALLVIAVQSLFFVVGRYRLVLLPAFALATAAGLQALAAARGRRLLGAALVAGVAVIVVWPWGLGFAREQLQVSSDENLAVRWTHLGSARRAGGDHHGAAAAWSQASLRYDRALQRHPDAVTSRLEAARLRVVLSDTLAALALIEGHPRGLAADIELPRLGSNLLLASRRLGDAVRHLEAALAHEPHDPVLLFNLTLALLHLNEPAAALPYTDRLRRAEPHLPRADLLAAQAHLARGDPDAARRVLREGLQRLPQQAELRGLLERLDRDGS
jgi:tetratricopeptide (TPR) repeat protein